MTGSRSTTHLKLNYDIPSDQMAALLNIGASIMNIVIGRGGTPLFTRDVSVGGNQYTDTLAEGAGFELRGRGEAEARF